MAPTLIQESGVDARPIEDKRAELAAVREPSSLLSRGRGARAARDRRQHGCMTLKGASPEYEGTALADRWELDEELSAVAARWEIAPERELVKQH